MPKRKHVRLAPGAIEAAVECGRPLIGHTKRSLPDGTTWHDSAPAADAFRRLVLERQLSKYKRLDDAGIAGVLKSVGRKIGRDVPDRRQLKDAINGVVSLTDYIRNNRQTPQPAIDRLRKAERALNVALEALLDCDGGLASISRALDGLAGRKPLTLDIFPQLPPALAMYIRFAMPALPSLESARQVVQARDGIVLLIKVVRARIEIVSRCQAKLKTRTSSRQADYCRYMLIITLVRVYEQFFGLAARVTRGKPCHVFLTEVLTRCGEKIGEERLYAIWLDARRWGLANGLIK